jgi:hypothetical protein
LESVGIQGCGQWERGARTPAQANSDICANAARSRLKTVRVEQKSAANFATVAVAIVMSVSLLLAFIVTMLAVDVTERIRLVLH